MFCCVRFDDAEFARLNVSAPLGPFDKLRVTRGVVILRSAQRVSKDGATRRGPHEVGGAEARPERL